MHPSHHILTCVALVGIVGCEMSPVAASTVTVDRHERAAAQLYGVGSGEVAGAACAAPGYRQFDFWVGRWSVVGIRPDGSLGPANPSVIERELDGCVIEENWTGTARSINTYDPAAGTYNQQYISTGGAHSVLTGGLLPDGSMEMTGTTFFACAACPNGIFPLIDIWRWTAITPDSVRQLDRQINGLNGQPWRTGIGFDGRYRRSESVVLGPTPTTGPCTNNPLHRQLDFLVGEWVITNGQALGRTVAEGRGPVTVTVTRELAGCLIEERVDGPEGYRGWSFNGWNQSEEVWYRTYANNRGDRVFLRGTLDGPRMVLTGTRALADGSAAKVRVTWEPAGADRVLETWAVSTDDGATYAVEQDVVRIRRAP